MLESAFLDILLLLIVLLMTSIGAYRGGLREAFSAAGVVLGVLLATEWAPTWGGWVTRNTSLTEAGAEFTIGVALLLLATVLVGYGVGTSFNYHPGPGGRMYGAVLGAASAIVAIAYVLTWLRDTLFSGDEPDVLRETWVARWLDGGAGTVLLIVSGALLAATLFGSFVRERDDEAMDAGQQEFAASSRRPNPVLGPSAPDKVEPAAGVTQVSVPVQVRPQRQWDDRAGEMPSRAGRQWSNTWPSDAPGIPEEERPSRAGQVQQARERRRSQQGGNGSGSNDAR
jgi:uncharacterized membrane protein required for colicin V production